jgi:hypothetical protein
LSGRPAPAVDAELDLVEAAIARLADGRAALDQVVAAHDEAARRLAGAERWLRAAAADVEREAARAAELRRRLERASLAPRR